MARMIPPQIHDSTVSAAERRVFNLLATDPETDGWTVLHSLGLARRRTGPYGEIDFVVVIPREGIICLEVKGGRVSSAEGVWHTKDRYGNTAELRRSPFMQARESAFALRDSIISHFGVNSAVSGCPIGSAVVFPDVESPPLTPEFERAEVVDTHDLRRPISHSLYRIVRARLRGFQEGIGERIPSHAQVKSIVQYLRPDFDLIVSRSVSLNESDARLLQLTEEQYDRLDELEHNPRCLFEGAAGTGKTLLAVEYCRRADSTGADVLFICFNRLLGDWLKQQVAGTRILAGTWHEVMKGLILKSSFSGEFSQRERSAVDEDNESTLFGELYPFYAELALEELEPSFDVLVMDEAQDLCERGTLDLLNRTLRGGLAGGTWAMFGDFTRQALYDSAGGSIGTIADYCQHYVRAKLTLNCRNTKRIALETAIASGFDYPPFRSMGQEGLPVEHRFWRTTDELTKNLEQTISRLINDGVPSHEIVVLSPRRLENSAIASLTSISGLQVHDGSRSLQTPDGWISFSTIHAFKGLESQVVIVIDVQGMDDERSQALLYVGMSRARSLLILMIHEQARVAIESRFRAAMEKEFQN